MAMAVEAQAARSAARMVQRMWNPLRFVAQS
jgi:hypothetical protein